MHINPSIPGWIAKFSQQYSEDLQLYTDELSYFSACQQSGLIYGYVVDYHVSVPIDDSHWDAVEKTKVAFLTALFCLYKLRKPTSDFTEFESELILFYTKISKSKFSFLHAILPESQASQKLESIIDDRIQSNVNVVAKSFSHIVTNAMLFIDVLAFDRFLTNGAIELKFFKEMEQKCMALILASLQVKKNKTPYDDLLVKLFENSLRYTKSSDELASYNVIVDTIIHDTLLQRMYLLDMAQMALWSDEIQDRDEQIYMNDLLSSFNLDNYIQNNDNQLHKFILNYKNNLPFFNTNHPVKHFYNNAQDMISKLIIRNKKRLVKELSESKELVKLLGKSTATELTYEEKKKVKKQLLDICKSVPSLTIFLLPGGSLLLPLLIKFIPQLLPSSFNENLED